MPAPRAHHLSFWVWKPLAYISALGCHRVSFTSTFLMAMMSIEKAGLFYLRLFYHFSVPITCYIYCYLILHNNPYCAYSPYRCTTSELSHINVRWEYKFAITACGIITSLKCYRSTAVILHRQQMPDYQRLLWTMTPITALICITLFCIYSLIIESLPCWSLRIPTSIRSDVEKKNCPIAVDGFASLCIAGGFTGFNFLMSALMEFLKCRRGRIMLETDPAEFEPVEVKSDKEPEEGSV